MTAAALEPVLDRAADGGRITPEEALQLYTRAPLHELGQAADAVRRRRYPDNIATYIIDRNINYTNVCVTACKFCAFYRAPNHAEGWTQSLDELRFRRMARRKVSTLRIAGQQSFRCGSRRPARRR